MKTTQYILLFTLIVLSCSPPNANRSLMETASASFSPEKGNPPTAEAPLTAKSFEKPLDTVLTEYHGLVLREALNSSPIKILTASQFHQEEIWPEAQTQTWIGLFESVDGHFLQQVEPVFDRVQDAIMDGANEKTGWKVSTDLEAQCIVLITGTQLAEGPVPTMGAIALLAAGDTIDVDLEIEPTQIILDGMSEDGFVSDYRVMLQSQSEGILKQQVLIDESRYIASMINILWAGDLDGDDRLDLIIDTSNHENAMAPTLFLSSHAEEGALVKAVAIHWTVGC